MENASIVIPARIGSERIKNKPLLEVQGMPLVYWTVLEAMHSKKASRVVISSDHEAVGANIKDVGMTFLLDEKPYRNGLERAFEASKSKVTLVLNCGSPLVKAKTMDQMISLIDTGKAEATAGVCDCTGFDMADTNVIKAVVSLDGHIVYMSRAPVPFPSNPLLMAGIKYKKLIGVSCFTYQAFRYFATSSVEPAELVEDIPLIRFLSSGWRIRAFDIDYPIASIETLNDVPKVESLIEQRRQESHKPVRPPRI